MSSVYRVLCLNHDPALTAADGDWNRLERAEEAIRAGVDGHAGCDLLIGRYSYPLIEVGCPGSWVRGEGAPGCGWHGPTKWVDADWLRLLHHAQRSPEGSELFTAAGQNQMRCWKPERLGRIAGELGISIPSARTTT